MTNCAYGFRLLCDLGTAVPFAPLASTISPSTNRGFRNLNPVGAAQIREGLES